MNQGAITDSDVITITMPSGEPEERTAARIQDMRSLEGATIAIGEQKRRVAVVGCFFWPSVTLRLVALIGALCLGGCSMPDPGDMSALNAEIAKQPEATKEKLRVGVVTTRLRDHRPATQVIEVYCREAGGPMTPAGAWEGMYELKGSASSGRHRQRQRCLDRGLPMIRSAWTLNKEATWRDFLVHYGVEIGTLTEEELLEEADRAETWDSPEVQRLPELELARREQLSF